MLKSQIIEDIKKRISNPEVYEIILPKHFIGNWENQNGLITFEENQNFIYRGKNGKTTIGTWKYLELGNKIVIISQGGDKDEFHIHKIDNNVLNYRHNNTVFFSNKID